MGCSNSKAASANAPSVTPQPLVHKSVKPTISVPQSSTSDTTAPSTPLKEETPEETGDVFFDALEHHEPLEPVAETSESSEVPEVPAQNELSTSGKAVLAAAVDAKKELLSYADDMAFAPHGKAGPVALSVRPHAGDVRQVVCGKMSFGDEFTLEEIRAFLMDISIKGSWDNMFEGGKTLEKFVDEEDYNVTLSWAGYKKQFGVSGRDFVYAVLYEKLSEDKFVISSRSIDFEEYPEGKFLKTHCRGSIINAGYVVEKVDGEVLVNFYNQYDIGGSVPGWIVNKVQLKQPASLADVFRAMKKRRA